MRRLIPTELYHYSPADLLLGLRAAAKRAPLLWAIDLPFLGAGIPVRSARAGIVVAIKALGLEPGSRIGVPLYCCPVVFKAVVAAGCVPQFLDVDPGTYCLSTEDLRAKSSGIEALIAVHMFGNLCDMPRVLEAVGDKPVIEDCAQSLGSRLNGRPAGAMGTISVFSFRLGKYLSAGEGAAICATSQALRDEVLKLVGDLDTPKDVHEFKHVLSAFIRSLLRTEPLWALAGSSLWRAYNRTTDFADKSPIVMSRMFKSDQEVLRRRLGDLDRMIRSQRENAQFYIDHLELDSSRLCLERPGAFYNRFMFPIVLDSTRDRDALRVFLKKMGVGSSTPYEEVIDGAARHYGYEGDCPAAERLLRTALVIPCHHALTERDRTLIVASLNKGLAETIGRGLTRSATRV